MTAGSGDPDRRGEHPGVPDGLRPGLPVVAASGDDIGVVKEVEEDRFQVDRSMNRDLWLSTAAVSDIRDGTVVLRVHPYEFHLYESRD